MRCLLCLMVVAVFVGCDMADYQRRMDANRERVKIFDEENKVLGKPLGQPPPLKYDDKEQPAWPFDVSLRLPKGISGTVDEEKGKGELTYNSFRAFRYPGDSEGYAVMVAAGFVGAASDKKDEKSKRSPHLSPGEFRVTLLHALHDFYRREYVANMRFPDPEKTTVTRAIPVPSPGAEKPATLTFDVYRWEGDPIKDKEKAAFTLFHHVAGDKQVAVVFQTPASVKDDPAELRKMELSVRSLKLR